MGIHLNHYFKKLEMLITVSVCMLLLTGCGKCDELDVYKANMAQFFDNVTVFDSNINALDPNSDTAVSDLLGYLDSMETSFSQMADLTVPEDFPGVEQLADEANDYMVQAVTLYHQAFESDPFDTASADLAKQNYDRANLRIQYILQILHGDIPEEIYTTVDEGNGFFNTGAGESGTEASTTEPVTEEYEEESVVEEGNVFADDYYSDGEETTSTTAE